MVRTTASGRSDLEFRYDAMGNRICKIVKPRTAGVGRQNQDSWTYTYYMRDASGNVIATYDRDYTAPSGTYDDVFTLKEDHLYGSSRTGIRSVSESQASTRYTYVSTSNGIFTGTFSSRTSTAASTTNFNHELGRKSYELSNHLGNVLVTVSDARKPNSSAGTVVGHTAVVKSAGDYYAFGSAMVGRTITGSGYRYTFNGKEADAETGLQDYGMRIYNPALGKFLSTDPLSSSYPMLTPYQFGSNRPIDGIDRDGLEWSKTVTYDPINDIYTVNVTLKVKVVNSSEHLTDAQMQEVMGEATRMFAATYSGTDPERHMIVNANLEYEVVEETTEEDPYVVSFEDTPCSEPSDMNIQMGLDEPGPNFSSKAGITDAASNTQYGRITVYTTRNNKGELRAVSKMARTLLHEAGHAAGLMHPEDEENAPDFTDEDLDVTDEDKTNNIMHQERNLEGEKATGSETTPGQRYIIIENIETQSQPQPE